MIETIFFDSVTIAKRKKSIVLTRLNIVGWGQETNKMYQRKVDIPMYPDRTRCEQKLNSKLTQLGYDKIDLHPGEYYLEFFFLTLIYHLESFKLGNFG